MSLSNQRKIVLVLLLLWPAPALAQWDVFVDPEVQSQCGVINAATLEFAVRVCDGALVLVTGQDAGFANTFVDFDGNVFIDGRQAGFVQFEEDGEGFFTLWWLNQDGWVIDFDDRTYEPFVSDFRPSDFANVPCAAGPQWEGDGDCGAELGAEIMEPLDTTPLLPGHGPFQTICGALTVSFILCTLIGLVSLRRRC